MLKVDLTEKSGTDYHRKSDDYDSKNHILEELQLPLTLLSIYRYIKCNKTSILIVRLGEYLAEIFNSFSLLFFGHWYLTGLPEMRYVFIYLKLCVHMLLWVKPNWIKNASSWQN